MSNLYETDDLIDELLIVQQGDIAGHFTHRN